MKKLIISLVIAFSFVTQCSEQSKIRITILAYNQIETDGITLFALGDYESDRQKIQKLCTAQYTPESSSSNFATFNNSRTRTCSDLLHEFTQQQNLISSLQKGSLEICDKRSWIPTCATSTHETIQAAIKAIQSSSAYQANLKQLKK